MSEQEDPSDGDYKGRIGKPPPSWPSDDDLQVIQRSTFVKSAKRVGNWVYHSDESEYGSDVDDGLLLQAETATQKAGDASRDDGDQQEDLPDAGDAEDEVMEDGGEVGPEK